MFVHFVHRVFSGCCFSIFVYLFFFFTYEMYKYNSLLIYIIKLGQMFRFKKKLKNQVTNLIQNLLWALACRERLQVDFLSYWFVCVKWIQILMSCDLNSGLWTALRWTVSTSLHSPTRWCLFGFVFGFFLASVSFCKTLKKKRGIVGVSDGAKHFI